MSFQAVIFDCDGVLVESEKLAFDLEVELLTALGCSVEPETFRSACFGKTEEAAFAYFQETWGDLIPPSFPDDYRTALNDLYQRDLVAIPEVSETLSLLDLPKAVASNSPSRRLTLALTKTGLMPHFKDHFFPVDAVEKGKPAPDLYLAAAASLGVKPHLCLAVEDSPTGVAAGRAAGMTVLGFTGGGHTFPEHGDLLRHAGAHAVCSRFSDLLYFLRENRKAS